MLTGITDAGITETINSNKTSMGKDDFLRLLVAQLENQDPLKPLDNAEFTAQLAQFSSLEQLFDVNKNIEAVQSLQSLLNENLSLNYLGKTVEATGNSFIYAGGEKALNFSLGSRADEAYLGIYDSNGDLVKTESLGPLAEGMQSYLWNGTDADGSPLPGGSYTFEISATRGDLPVQSATFISGIVSSVRFENGNTILTVGGTEITAEQIQKIT